MAESPKHEQRSSIPKELRSRSQWIVWKAERSRKGKDKKVLYCPKTNRRASVSKPTTWGTFDSAQAALANGCGYDGVGFVFALGDGLVGIDIDDCIDSDGKMKPWAQEIIDLLDSYTELSPSATGVHVFLKAVKPGDLCKKKYGDGEIEIYSHKRFFTVGGDSFHTPPKPIAERQAQLDQLYEIVFGSNGQPESVPTEKSSHLPCKNENLSDDQIVEMASGAQNGDKFKRLWEGNNTLWEGSERLYPSQSEADLALCDMLAFYVGGDSERIDNLFRQSGLIRDKWDRSVGQGETHGERCMRLAIESVVRNTGEQQVEPSSVQSNKPPELPNLTRADIMLPAPEFVATDFPEREIILNPWLLEQSMTMIAGWRGIGKSWAVMSLLGAVAKGKSFGPWKVKKTVPCAYLDGEMAQQETLERIQALGLKEEDLFFIYSDAHANFKGLPRTNLLDAECRAELKQILLAKEIKLWAIDNLGALMPGADENVKQDWDPVNSWLLELRFAGISTIVLHHVGKGNTQRGTSAHEDNLDISLLLKAPPGYKPEDGARFIAHFDKKRVHTDDPQLVSDVEFQLKKLPSGRVEWAWHYVEGQKKVEIIRMLDEDNLNQTEIAEVVGVNKSYVTKIKGEAIREGLLTKECTLTEKGCAYVN